MEIQNTTLNIVKILFGIDLVDDLLVLTDKYDFAILREKCVEFVSDYNDDLCFRLRTANKYVVVRQTKLEKIYEKEKQALRQRDALLKGMSEHINK